MVEAAFKRPSNVHVNMAILHPRPVVGLGNLLIMHKGTTPPSSQPSSNTKSETLGNGSDITSSDIENGIIYSKTDVVSGARYREYVSLDAVQIDFPDGTPVSKKAEGYFAQNNHSDKVAVLTYTDDKIEEALQAFWFNDWVFAVQAENNIEDIKAMLNIFEANQDHIILGQSNTLTDFDALSGGNYSIGIKHDLSEAMDSAFVGQLANLTVGSITYKFKQLNGITPEDVTSIELEVYNKKHLISYISIGGVPETSAGTVMSGDYIDAIHGDLWIKTHITDALQSLLQNSPKIPYDQSGINLIASTVNTVLAQAYTQGIIKTDDATGKGIYSVDPRPRSEQSAIDLSNRHYGGIRFSYDRAGAIEDVTVNGTISSDTITQVLG